MPTNDYMPSHFRAATWLPGPHAQTIAGRYLRRPTGVSYRRERVELPDGDFVDLDWLDVPQRPAAEGGALLVLFHGLEGSSRSHYAEAFAGFAREQGLAYVVPHFRGCSGELNLGPRAYHSGDADEGLCIHCNKCMATIYTGTRCVLVDGPPPPQGNAGT